MEGSRKIVPSKRSKETIWKDIIRKETDEKLRKEKEQLNLIQDEKMRKYVKRKMEEYIMEERLSKEKAAELIMQNKGIVKHFSYYTKNGIDMKKMFIEWIEQREKTNWMDRTERF